MHCMATIFLGDNTMQQPSAKVCLQPYICINAAHVNVFSLSKHITTVEIKEPNI